MSEVDDISQGLSKELRGLFAAALALAQIAAQRRAARSGSRPPPSGWQSRRRGAGSRSSSGSRPWVSPCPRRA